MLKSRLEAQQLAEKFGIQPVPRNAQVCVGSRAEGWLAGVSVLRPTSLATGIALLCLPLPESPLPPAQPGPLCSSIMCYYTA